MRDHTPIVIDKLNGLWDRGEIEEVPQDHFTSGENFRFVGSTGIASRWGIDKHQDVAVPLGNIVRLYNYVTQNQNTLIVLTWDGTDGKIYHVVDGTTVHGPVLTIAGMSDFAFVPYNGRAYLSPFNSTLVGDLYVERGLNNEFVYVYKGDGTAARKIAGTTPAGTIIPANGAAGHTDAGFKLFAVVGETDTGFRSSPFAFNSFTTSATNSVSFSAIPTLVGAQWIKRHVVATININDYNGNTTGYTYYFIEGATVNDNVTTTLANISFYDTELLDEASFLLDNFTEVAAGTCLTIYHDRLVIGGEYDNPSIVRLSAKGDPESINQVDGLLIVPLDGNPVTNAQELRDVLYITKRNKTFAYVDNDDVPASWPPTVIDQGIGAPVHGIATVLDSGGSNVDFLIMASYKGIIIFNGKYVLPELSWKLGGSEGFWLRQSLLEFRKIQLLNDSIKQILYCILPDLRLLIGDYGNGLDPKNIRWSIWRADITINTIALININTLIIGAETRRVS